MTKNPTRRVLVVGAGWDQAPIIREAKRQGHYVVAVDGNPNAYGMQLADVAYAVSTRDCAGVLAVAQRERVDALTYMITESPLYAIRHAADALGLPAPSHKAVEATVSKPRMREIFGAVGIPNPGYGRAASLDEALCLAERLGFPLVLKSADVGGQLGLFRLERRDDLELAFSEARSFSVSGEVILEQLLEGPEINVVGIVLDGRIRELTVSDRETHANMAFGVAIRHLYPSSLDAGTIECIGRLCQRAVEAMELQAGIIFPQLIVSENGPQFVEIGVRIPGGLMKELFEYATGVDLAKLQLAISLGQPIRLADHRSRAAQGAVTVKFINGEPGPLAPGTVARVTRRAEALAMPGIVEAGFYNDPTGPQHIRPLRTGRDRFYYLMGVGRTREEVVSATDHAATLLDFEDAAGNSLKTRPAQRLCRNLNKAVASMPEVQCSG